MLYQSGRLIPSYYRTYFSLISCLLLLPPNHTVLLEIKKLVIYWEKFLVAKTTWNELFTGLEERLAKSMLQLRNKPTLSPKQLEADKTLSSKVLEKQQFRVLLASSGRRDNTGRMLRGKNEHPRRRMWRELEIEWLRSHGEIEQRQIRHRKRCWGIQSILRDLRNKPNKIDRSKWLRKANGNEIKWTIHKI